MFGYKGFNKGMTCRGFQYEVGQTYETKGKIELCKSGFHFCPKMADVFDYYGSNDCRYAEVEALGQVIKGNDKCVTDRLRIVRELTKAEVFDAMYAQSGLELKDLPFPALELKDLPFSADEVIKTREDGTLDKLLPSGTEFPVRFSNGEWNVLVVARDKRYTYLVTKYIMAEPFAMNDERTNKGGWPASDMRKHVQEIYGMLPENFRKAVIPMHIRQLAHGTAVECDDPAFLLSAVNIFGEEAVFGEEEYSPEADCDDTQIDIFHYPTARIKGRPGASSASWWWLRSANYYSNFYGVTTSGDWNYDTATSASGVVVGFCIESRA